MTAPDRHRAAIGLGSNLGDKAGTIGRALRVLVEAGIFSELRASRLYSTAPWGPVEQDCFVNACAIGETTLGPEALLMRCKAVETALGRTETVRWGPRVIDIDILFYEDRQIDSAGLTLPHAGLMKRAFVLVPLAELCPEQRIGDTTVAAAAAAIDRSGVELLE